MLALLTISGLSCLATRSYSASAVMEIVTEMEKAPRYKRVIVRWLQYQTVYLVFNGQAVLLLFQHHTLLSVCRWPRRAGPLPTEEPSLFNSDVFVFLRAERERERKYVNVIKWKAHTESEAL